MLEGGPVDIVTRRGFNLPTQGVDPEALLARTLSFMTGRVEQKKAFAGLTQSTTKDNAAPILHDTVRVTHDEPEEEIDSYPNWKRVRAQVKNEFRGALKKSSQPSDLIKKFADDPYLQSSGTRRQMRQEGWQRREANNQNVVGLPVPVSEVASWLEDEFSAYTTQEKKQYFEALIAFLSTQPSASTKTPSVELRCFLENIESNYELLGSAWKALAERGVNFEFHRRAVGAFF